MKGAQTLAQSAEEFNIEINAVLDPSGGISEYLGELAFKELLLQRGLEH